MDRGGLSQIKSAHSRQIATLIHYYVVESDLAYFEGRLHPHYPNHQNIRF